MDRLVAGLLCRELTWTVNEGKMSAMVEFGAGGEVECLVVGRLVGQVASEKLTATDRQRSSSFSASATGAANSRRIVASLTSS